MTCALIAIGSNVGDRLFSIERSLPALGALPGVKVVRASGVIETDPVGPQDQGRYLNAAAVVETSLDAFELLACMLGIEHWLGRDRSRERRWGPRVIDLDLIAHGDLILNTPDLTLPHPRMHEREFVLRPLAEIAPDFVIPGLHATVSELLSRFGNEAHR
ncbi:MAG: 2-amino-4-hydroxy-6-hydroxymethyldihydropteridine diphosphokinase [Planctomycetota bacterium]